MKKRTLFKMAAAAVALTVSGTFVQADTTKIRYGYLPVPNAPLFAAQAHGLFEKYDLDVELIKFTSGPAEFQSLQAGSIDLAQGALAAFYMASSRGLDAHWVYSFGDAGPIEGIVVAEDSGINSYADLKGKKITAPSGSILHLSHIYASKQAGVDIADIDFISLPPPQAVPALENGNVDAAWFWEPFITISSTKGARLLSSSPDLGVADVFGIAGSGDWLNDEANSDAVARLFKAFEEGEALYRENPEKTLASIKEYTGINPELATRIIDGIEWASLGDQTSDGSKYNLNSGSTPGEGARAVIEWVQENALAGDLMEKPGDLENFLDGRAAAKALK